MWDRSRTPERYADADRVAQLFARYVTDHGIPDGGVLRLACPADDAPDRSVMLSLHSRDPLAVAVREARNYEERLEALREFVWVAFTGPGMTITPANNPDALMAQGVQQ